MNSKHLCAISNPLIWWRMLKAHGTTLDAHVPLSRIPHPSPSCSIPRRVAIGLAAPFMREARQRLTAGGLGVVKKPRGRAHWRDAREPGGHRARGMLIAEIESIDTELSCRCWESDICITDIYSARINKLVSTRYRAATRYRYC